MKESCHVIGRHQPLRRGIQGESSLHFGRGNREGKQRAKRREKAAAQGFDGQGFGRYVPNQQPHAASVDK